VVKIIIRNAQGNEALIQAEPGDNLMNAAISNGIDGIMPAIFTPFTRGGKEVDYDRACAYAHYLADKGVQGIFVAGTSGEGLLMSLDERKTLVEALIQAVGKRIRVIVQTGCLDTPSTLELTLHAKQAGAHAVAIYTPEIGRASCRERV